MTVGSLVHGTLVSLQSIEATLHSLAAKTNDREAKEAFYQSAINTQEVIRQIQTRKGEIEREEPQYQQQ
ncbi:DUF1657 domain-containing protein [Salipaludibacillus daqingensis]|uniref:DUF1657 domain-containing protein n=1 Tax=Salipaludibacillus daqingensis TaxID=3041001 RepID=UPI0024735E1F|nr:DUF1657 domain-containing protein [Salipaludibacillus daqingensis]